VLGENAPAYKAPPSTTGTNAPAAPAK